MPINTKAAWTQAMTDVRGMNKSFNNVTLRTSVIPTISGEEVRIELSNRFGYTPLVIGHIAITAGRQTEIAKFSRQNAITIPSNESFWTDSISMSINKGSEIIIDIYLPNHTVYSTSNLVGCPLQVSTSGDFVGQTPFQSDNTPTMTMPDGSEIPLSTPFLRSVDVLGSNASAVIVCLGDSITAGGYPEIATSLLPSRAAVAFANRGIGGNRLQEDADTVNAHLGRSGITRFNEDVLGTSGATHLVIALGTNDLGLSKTMKPYKIPSASQLINAYKHLTELATKNRLEVIIATITPFMNAEGYDAEHEDIRSTVNDWVRTSAPNFVDFDLAIRSQNSPTQLDKKYDFGDHLHPNDAGQTRLAMTMVEKLKNLKIC